MGQDYLFYPILHLRINLSLIIEHLSEELTFFSLPERLTSSFCDSSHAQSFLQIFKMTDANNPHLNPQL